MVTETGPEPEVAAQPGIAPVLSTSPVGRRRRPSGEPPPLPRHIERSSKVHLVLIAVAAGLAVGVSVTPVLAAVTAVDLALLDALERVRWSPITSVLQTLQALGSQTTVPVIAWATILVLVAFRRFQHLAAYLIIVLAGSVLTSSLISRVGRMRPTGVDILGRWDGYSHPSEPLAVLALVLAGVTYTLLPAGAWRRRGRWAAGGVLGLLATAQLYLAVDHPSDVFAALVIGWSLPVVAFRLAVPEEVFPVSYRRGRRAHLDVGGRRGEAIKAALDQQLGLDVTSVEPFALEGSAGSTPLRLRVLGTGPADERLLFGKLYARNHLRSDRWYKLGRTILYGRLEDEKPFSTVRRLVEYEDHMLRLLRDAGLATPAPYGFVEITPEREYAIMEFFPGAVDITDATVDDAVIDEGLAVVRRLWDAGVAHRDIKPSNVLVQAGHVRLIDVAFAAVRPTPWRQAVDLANMMLTLALSSSPERVYERALLQFAPDDIAEAFAASRGITVPTQLRARIRADDRDLVARFCALAPERPPVPIQLWSVRRVGLTIGVVALSAGVLALVVGYLQIAGLL